MNAVTLFGVIAVSFMMLMYALERRHSGFVLGFTLGCLLSSTYGFLSGAWPFGVVEAIWAVVAFRRSGQNGARRRETDRPHTVALAELDRLLTSRYGLRR